MGAGRALGALRMVKRLIDLIAYAVLGFASVAATVWLVYICVMLPPVGGMVLVILSLLWLMGRTCGGW